MSMKRRIVVNLDAIESAGWRFLVVCVIAGCAALAVGALT